MKRHVRVCVKEPVGYLVIAQSLNLPTNNTRRFCEYCSGFGVVTVRWVCSGYYLFSAVQIWARARKMEYKVILPWLKAHAHILNTQSLSRGRLPCFEMGSELRGYSHIHVLRIWIMSTIRYFYSHLEWALHSAENISLKIQRNSME